jgi:hypothetical protein
MRSSPRSMSLRTTTHELEGWDGDMDARSRAHLSEIAPSHCTALEHSSPLRLLPFYQIAASGSGTMLSRQKDGLEEQRG